MLGCQYFHGCRQVWREEAQRSSVGSLGQMMMKMVNSIGARVPARHAVNRRRPVPGGQNREEPRLLFMYVFIYLLFIYYT